MDTSSLSWEPDRLGDGFECTTLQLGPDPDGEGDAVATLVAYNRDTPGFTDRPALLWVHGMTDYFYNTPAARHFHDAGYAFYALDLRKCGRSRRDGHTWHYITDLETYFTDLNAALSAIPNASVTPIAHSTGGLICALWVGAQHPPKVTGLIFNGPWFGMMGVPAPVYRAVAPVLDGIGKRWPRIPFPGGGLAAFGDSMHASRFGEWDYDLEWKPLSGHKKYTGWLAAIIRGFRTLHSGTLDLHIPFLTLCSTRSILGASYHPEVALADAVVDVTHTMRWAPTLGSQCTLRPIHGAGHDAFASRQPARDEVYKVVDEWLAIYTGNKE